MLAEPARAGCCSPLCLSVAWVNLPGHVRTSLQHAKTFADRNTQSVRCCALTRPAAFLTVICVHRRSSPLAMSNLASKQQRNTSTRPRIAWSVSVRLASLPPTVLTVWFGVRPDLQQTMQRVDASVNLKPLPRIPAPSDGLRLPPVQHLLTQPNAVLYPRRPPVAATGAEVGHMLVPHWLPSQRAMR